MQTRGEFYDLVHGGSNAPLPAFSWKISQCLLHTHTCSLAGLAGVTRDEQGR